MNCYPPTVSALAFSGLLLIAQSVAAQTSPPAPDKAYHYVHTYVEHMPIYQGEEGTKKLTKDLLREFKAASARGGCIPPNFPVYVSLIVSHNGAIYDVKSTNNQPPTPIPEPYGPNGWVLTTPKRSLRQLPTTCEKALVEASQRLPRLKPGTQNGRRVAVNLVLRLI
jgi:hypothetical protein